MIRPLPLLWLALSLSPGCVSSSGTSGGKVPTYGPNDLSVEAIQTIVRSFGDDHIRRVHEATDRLMLESPDLALRVRANAIKLETVQSSISIASTPNPVVGMIDMYVSVEMQREATRRSILDRTLSEAEQLDPAAYVVGSEALEAVDAPLAKRLLVTYGTSSREVRTVAEQVLWPDQLTHLDKLMDDWWVLNPRRRYVSKVRMQDFARIRGASVAAQTRGPRSVFGLLRLDPLASMDPATREIAQTRMLVERLGFLAQRLPLAASLEAKVLIYETLLTEEISELREGVLTANDSAGVLASAVDRWPEDVTAVTETAVARIEEAATRQREELLEAIDSRSSVIDGTLGQLNETLNAAASLSDSVRSTIVTADELAAKHAPAAPSEPTEPVDYQALAVSVTATLEQLERSLDAYHRVLEPTDASMGNAAELSRQVLDEAYRRGLRLILVAAAALVAAGLLLRFAARWMAPRERRT